MNWLHNYTWMNVKDAVHHFLIDFGIKTPPIPRKTTLDDVYRCMQKSPITDPQFLPDPLGEMPQAPSLPKPEVMDFDETHLYIGCAHSNNPNVFLSAFSIVFASLEGNYQGFDIEVCEEMNTLETELYALRQALHLHTGIQTEHRLTIHGISDELVQFLQKPVHLVYRALGMNMGHLHQDIHRALTKTDATLDHENDSPGNHVAAALARTHLHLVTYDQLVKGIHLV